MAPQLPTDQRFEVAQDRPGDGIHLLRLAGALADGAASRLPALAREQLAACPRLLALDLSDLTGLALAGARILEDIAEWAGEADIALCLIVPPDHPVRAVLVAADLGELFELHPDLPTAIAEMS